GFETPTNIQENFGQRLRALLVPPVSGSYVFFISSDDNSQLFLSTDATPANRKLIAWVDGWTDPRQYHVSAGQKSAPVSLVAGQRYYIEALVKENGGGDNLAVTWQKPGESLPPAGAAPIPNGNLIPYGLGAPVFTLQPSSLTVVENATASFSARLERQLGATWQWLRNGTNLPGATTSSCTVGPVRLADSGDTFFCRASNSYGTTNSAVALLTVVADTTRPTISFVQNFGDPTLVTVGFSEPLDAVFAGDPASYFINNGIAVVGATLLGDGATVLLRTAPLASDITYILTVSNVRDGAQTPNVILPSSQRSFVLTYTPLDISHLIGTNEPPGPSSRRTALAISEIMYHPAPRSDGRNVEFIEIYNSNPWAEDLAGHRLTGDVNFTFPPGTAVGPLSYCVVAANPADVQAVYGLANVLGPMTGATGSANNALPNSGGNVTLLDEQGAVLLQVDYDDDPPWPAAADGAGHSLVLARPSRGEADPRAWAASGRRAGSPGSPDAPANDAWRAVLINEVLTHTDPPLEDFIELFNYSSAAISLEGCVLTDDPATNKFQIPAGTSIPARGFLAFTSTQLGFALSSAGETVYLVSSDGSRVIDSLRFGPQENGISFGRCPDGAPQLRRLSKVTSGLPNAPRLVNNVVISEMMYHPPGGEEADAQEFVEIHNRDTGSVNLANWRLAGGIDFTFPSGTTISSGGYLVVGSDAANLLAAHPGLGSSLVLGNFSGKLGNGGDTIVLEKPDTVASTNALGQWVTNLIYIAVDQVSYGTGGRWGRWSDGDGSSLERIDPRSDAEFAPNWADSDETGKSPWTTVEFTGVLDLGAMAGPDQLQIFLMGAGECLVDNIEVVPAGGANVLVNGTFDSNTDGWFFQGTHEDSHWQTGGYSGGCLRVVAADRGDPGANRIRTVLTQTLTPNTSVTLRAKVKWLKGHPEILLRLRGNWLEAAGLTRATRNLGSPGLANTQSLPCGPAISDVRHSPVLPLAGQSVTVSARIDDPDSIAFAVLKYRVDPASNYSSVVMTCRGAGYYSAIIPGQAAGKRVAFSIEAKDGSARIAASRFPAETARECLIGFGESTPGGSFGSYRLWVTQANVNRWATREKQSNRGLDATFVYGGFRVCYNVDTLYSGSPFHTPGYNSPDGNACDYEVNFQKDDALLGVTDFVLGTIGNLNSDPSFQAERTAYWISRQLGAPYLHRRYVRLFFNGQLRSQVYEDCQQPNSDVVSGFFPEDDAGDLFKIEDWFEFDDTGDNRLGNIDATLGNFTTTGGAKKTARYRWNWRARARGSLPSDFTNLFTLVDAVNAAQPEPFRAHVAA
ncbi:MAG TPA: lamin tail domain-containing protein, partial [Clostridia bacterium]|nr:lamin tail domain-containing protein [Clostridia bacterium]